MDEGAAEVPKDAESPSRMRGLLLPALAVVVVAALLLVYFMGYINSPKSNVAPSVLQNNTTVRNASPSKPVSLGNTIFNGTSSSEAPPSLP
jgi:hypothetical protein